MARCQSNNILFSSQRLFSPRRKELELDRFARPPRRSKLNGNRLNQIDVVLVAIKSIDLPAFFFSCAVRSSPHDTRCHRSLLPFARLRAALAGPPRSPRLPAPCRSSAPCSLARPSPSPCAAQPATRSTARRSPPSCAVPPAARRGLRTRRRSSGASESRTCTCTCT
jgi:hypothetical protein